MSEPPPGIGPGTFYSPDGLGNSVLAPDVGALWPETAPAEKRRYIDQWFDEIQIGRRTDTNEVLPTERMRGLIYAACTTSFVGLPIIQRG